MQEVNSIRPNSFQAWLLAIRPRTLTSSTIPVCIAGALAFNNGVFQWIPFVCCFLFALLAQISSNIANDYFDFVKGTDREDRLGPLKATANGYIEPKKVKYASFASIILACLFGSVLIYYGGWEMILVGLVVSICVFAYTTGPLPLSYLGLGDLFVILFYGIVPVGFSYYVQAHDWTTAVTICGLATGLLSTNILITNNYRDMVSDKLSNKRTTIVRFGKKFGSRFYLFNCIACILLCQYFWLCKMPAAALLPALGLPAFIRSWKLLNILQGKELNRILFQSAMNVLLFGALLSLGIIIS